MPAAAPSHAAHASSTQTAHLTSVAVPCMGPQWLGANGRRDGWADGWARYCMHASDLAGLSLHLPTMVPLCRNVLSVGFLPSGRLALHGVIAVILCNALLMLIKLWLDEPSK
jgi:hypothetical protein